MSKFDIKVGYSCNNNCIHCVIRPRKRDMIAKGEKLDLTYSKIIELTKTEEFKKANIVILTGGEITIRRDFIRILKYISSKFPNKNISIQTNGRNLSSEKIINEIVNLRIPSINFVVAIHGEEELHNQISNSNSGNPYQETIRTIKYIFKDKVFGESSAKRSRLEVVLSKKNYKETPIFLEKLIIKYNIPQIGISYPHAENMDPKTVFDWYPSYLDIKNHILSYYNMIKKFPNVRFAFEEFPKCLWIKDGQYINMNSLKNYYAIEDNIFNSIITVAFTSDEVISSFLDSYRRTHAKSTLCDECLMRHKCLGVWEENIELYDGIGLEPIRKENLIC